MPYQLDGRGGGWARVRSREVHRGDAVSAPRARVRVATKAAFARAADMVRGIGIDLDKCAIEFAPDGGVRFVPGAQPVARDADTWADL